jgi:ABC-2 type transport system permease protein
MLYNPQMKSSYNFVPGIMGLIFILICALMTSVSIVREKETGTMEVLLTSPVKPINIIFAKMIPYFTISCVNLITILLLAFFVLDVPMAGSLFWLCILSLIYIFLSLALGLLISTLVKTQVAAMLGSIMALMLPAIMLSGMIFPVENMPLILQWISNIVPAKWYIAATKKLMIEGVSVHYIIREIAVLSGMSILLIVLALRNFKNRLE